MAGGASVLASRGPGVRAGGTISRRSIPTDRTDPSDPKSASDYFQGLRSGDRRAVQAPRIGSFLEFLERHARVPTSDLRHAGEFVPYTFTGREALREPCRVLDQILGVAADSLSPSGGEGRGEGAGRAELPIADCGLPIADSSLHNACVSPSPPLAATKPAAESGSGERAGVRGRGLSKATGSPAGESPAGLTAGGSPAPLKDSTLVLAGGAQFGKTILELYLAAYVTSQRFLNLGVYLPDDGLADGIVDTKFRPVVLDTLGWFAEMTQIGKAVNKSGKAVHTKGAFLVTDGVRKAVGLFRGLKKIPTSFSLDVIVRDEEDDIPRDKAKFLSSRLTASALRLQIIIGTQRVAGAGQNRQWEQGSQGVVLIGAHSGAGDSPARQIAGESPAPLPGWLTPEEHWPQICRLQLGSEPSPDDPQLSWEGDFRRDGNPVAEHSPDARYYLAHPETGRPLDRSRVIWHHRRPEQIKLRRWSFRISQLGCAAIDLAQIVSHWTRAVADADEMTSFCCDRLARPKSASQSLTPQILRRSREIEPFEYGPSFVVRGSSTTDNEQRTTNYLRFAGLDTGDRCWFFLRETESAAVKRCVRCDQVALGDVVNRARALFQSHRVGCLFIDERPAVSEARTLALLLNGLDTLDRWPRVDWLDRQTYVSLPGGLTWDGRNRRWLNLRCALVRFSRRALGAGIEQTAAEFTEGAQTKFVPLIECNRFETIDRVVREFLTPAENVIEVVDNAGEKRVRQEPSMRLPRRVPGAPGVLETLDAHLLTGSQRSKDEKTGELGDYVDACDNHFLLADAYSALAETVCIGNRHSGGGVENVRGWMVGSNKSSLDR